MCTQGFDCYLRLPTTLATTTTVTVVAATRYVRRSSFSSLLFSIFFAKNYL
jgi:hypothetical protein